MMRKNSMVDEHAGAGDAREFWNDVLDCRINHIESAPPVQQYSNTAISSIEALDEEKRALQDEIENRCDNEDHALRSVLDALHEHRAREECTTELTIADIHRRRNGLIPISRLPPEILSQILVLHAQLEPLKWIKAALTSIHVCSQWRQVGLGCPGLWSRIDCRSAAWMATMMERSRSVPLSLVIDEKEDICSRKMALIADNMHRFEHLGLCIPNPNTHQFLELFSRPVPLLENLDLWSVGNATPVFPSEFLGGSAPQLRHITLAITYSHVPWTSGLFANLVTLHIRKEVDREPDEPEGPSLETLLSALAKMPRLETLTLLGCLPPPISSTTITHADFPNLNFFSTGGPLKQSTCLFRHITINSSATVRIHITRFRVSKEDVDEFFAVFPSRLFIAPPTAYALGFDWEFPFSFRADAWTVQQAAEVKDEDAHIALAFDQGSEDLWGISPLDLVWPCFATFASPQLQSFDIADNHIIGWDIEVWRKLARASLNLRKLTLGKVQFVELLKALHPPDGQDLAPTDCCLPALSCLGLSAPPNHPMPTSDGETAPLSEVLSTLLSARATAGCPVSELVFFSSSEEDFVGDWSKPFRDAVPGIIVQAVE